MTERMILFRSKQEQKGLVQIRLWVNKDDEKFFKYLAKESRPQKEILEKKRFGHTASQSQIKEAKAIAEAKNLKEPKHLYNYHISLRGWMWAKK